MFGLQEKSDFVSCKGYHWISWPCKFLNIRCYVDIMFEDFIPCIDGENAYDEIDCVEEDSFLERYRTANADFPTCLLPIIVIRIGESK